jgi:hypothetical protein
VDVIARWKLMADWVMPAQGGPAQPLTVVIGPPIPPGEKIGVVPVEQLRGAVEDADKARRALETIAAGKTVPMWARELARTALGGQ